MFMYFFRNKIFELEHIEHINSTFYLRDHDDDITNIDEYGWCVYRRSISLLFVFDHMSPILHVRNIVHVNGSGSIPFEEFSLDKH